ncbi:MAG: rRNA maturation RNase YbeY [Blastocatellia bacterium]|nr:rRNA maturation RNase YbeY [Blastocatellia bacterium]
MIVNVQRKIKFEARAFAGFLADALDALDEPGGDAAVAFVSDRRMRELNKLFRGKYGTTDVLSFPHEAESIHAESDGDESGTFLGDIVISAEQAARQAAENGLSLDLELKQLILHGILHLSGYDHETDDGEMNARELELRDKLNIA